MKKASILGCLALLALATALFAAPALSSSKGQQVTIKSLAKGTCSQQPGENVASPGGGGAGNSLGRADRSDLGADNRQHSSKHLAKA